MVTRMKKGEEKRCGIVGHAVVFSKPSSGATVSEPNRTKAQALANTRHLTICMRNHLQCSKPVNSTSTVVDTLEPTVYIRTIIPYRINSVELKVCAYWRLLFKVVILKS